MPSMMQLAFESRSTTPSTFGSTPMPPSSSAVDVDGACGLTSFPSGVVTWRSRFTFVSHVSSIIAAGVAFLSSHAWRPSVGEGTHTFKSRCSPAVPFASNGTKRR
jgi:hypothetical protein